MGNIIASKCRICNFENTFKYGGNRFDYQTNCPVPAINIKTGEFENVNYKIEINNFCQHIRFKRCFFPRKNCVLNCC